MTKKEEYHVIKCEGSFDISDHEMDLIKDALEGALNHWDNPTVCKDTQKLLDKIKRAIND